MNGPGPQGATLGLAEAADVHRFSHEAMATMFEVRSAHPDAALRRPGGPRRASRCSTGWSRS